MLRGLNLGKVLFYYLTTPAIRIVYLISFTLHKYITKIVAILFKALNNIVFSNLGFNVFILTSKSKIGYVIFSLERDNGIEPSSSAWKAEGLPLTESRKVRTLNLAR